MVANSFTKTPIELENSDKVIIWPDGIINESSLIRLLNEAYSKNLSTKQRIICYQRIRDPDQNWEEIGDPEDIDYIDKKIILSYKQLNNFYRTLEGVVEDYSPESEENRIIPSRDVFDYF